MIRLFSLLVFLVVTLILPSLYWCKKISKNLKRTKLIKLGVGNSIHLSNAFGVSPIGEDTLTIAFYLKKMYRNKKKNIKALDMGTGTGALAIYLKKRGMNVEAVDINPLAIRLAKLNALRNGLKIRIYQSNLFSNVNNLFDLIIFNPPYGSFSYTPLSEILEVIKSFFPKENKSISKLFFKLLKKNRMHIILKFLLQSKKHLKKNGKILLLVHDEEIKFLKKLSPAILKNKNLVLVQFKKR